MDGYLKVLKLIRYFGIVFRTCTVMSSAAPGRCIQRFGKIRNEKFHFCFKILSKWVFSTFSIFPTSSLAYFYGIFDQKLISSIFSDIFDFKVGGYGQKVGAVMWSTIHTLHAVSLYTPSRERKYTFSEYAKHLYRARKRVCRARTVLKTS